MAYPTLALLQAIVATPTLDSKIAAAWSGNESLSALIDSVFAQGSLNPDETQTLLIARALVDISSEDTDLLSLILESQVNPPSILAEIVVRSYYDDSLSSCTKGTADNFRFQLLVKEPVAVLLASIQAGKLLLNHAAKPAVELALSVAIPLYVHDGFQRHRFARYHPPLGRYELKGINHRANLCSLRSVNRLFHQLVTPLLFQHAVITSSCGVTRLQQLSKNPSLRRLVRRLEICVEVQPVTDFDTYDAKLNMNEDRNLAYLARLAIVIHSALPRFSNLEILKLGFTDIPYRLDRDVDSLGISGCYWEQDTANLFESLATAMRRSQLDKLDEVDLSLPLAFDFGHFLDDDDDDDDDIKRYSAGALFQRLKYLRLNYEYSTDEGEGVEFRWRQHNEDYDKYIRQLLPLAPNIHSLALKGSDVLMLDQSAFATLHLRSLNLESLSITGDASTALVRQSTALEDVVLRGVYLESGTWKEILSAMSQLPMTSFYIETCGYQMESESGYFRPPNPGSHPSDAYIETTEADDLDACEAVFSQVQENKRQIYGSKYDEAVDVERRRVEVRAIEIKWNALTEL